MRGFAALVLSLVFLSVAITCNGALQRGFYLEKCGENNVEDIIRDVVESRFSKDPTIVAALLRLHFHDCFVSGCDGSLLLNGTDAEKNAGPNFSVRGYDLIDEAKDAVEKACPGVVSCADIIAVATRDAVFMAKGLNYKVETGRRDSLVSSADNVDLPGPSITVKNAIALFKRKGLDKMDMVLLLGAHTVGVTHCSFIGNRLYNFNNTGKKDPTMEASLFKSLSKTCPKIPNDSESQVALDQTINSTNILDNGYLTQVKGRRGILQIDQNIGLDASTGAIVRSFVDGPLKNSFQSRFGGALIKMGRVGVLTGKNEGEIRRTCGAVNP
ncbi:peroxidase 60-like [Papaver somniferum]|uniref:peroxidase 60-like n=1 Tax=Papaver somniferum TaxID=3469 RepID=UPI000E6F773A|nr:peroxidase 60-like [Papaver somniferum]